MKCAHCGCEINRLNHHFIPDKNSQNGGKRYCFKCSQELKAVSLM